MEKQLTIHDINIGDRAEYSKMITRAEVKTFAEITGDFNPLHVDEAYAKQTRFGACISHGALLAGLISTVVGMKLPGTGALYESQSLRFTRPVFIGDTVTAIAEVIEKIEDRNRVVMKTRCINQHGDAVAEGQSVLLPYKTKS